MPGKTTVTDTTLPDQSNVERRPYVCPHCGNELPAEPELLPLGGPYVTYPDPPRARFAPDRARVEVYGGESGFTEPEPYVIEAERVATAGDVGRFMAHVGSQAWAVGEEFFDELAEALEKAHDAEPLAS